MNTAPHSYLNFGEDGYALAAGSVFGVRWWEVWEYPDGGLELRGVYGPWSPGLNRARCHRDDRYHRRYLTDARYLFSPPPPPADDAPDTLHQHRSPYEKCTCGFYAFWQGEVPRGLPTLWIGIFAASALAVEVKPFKVMGVIEGSGRTLIGTRGFRCEQARITALHFADDERCDLVEINRVELAIGTLYGVPVYATSRLMLSEHPPTTDYRE